MKSPAFHTELSTDSLVPPHSIDAELSTLGAMAIEGLAIDTVLEILDPCDFYRHPHQSLCAAMFDLHMSGGVVDLTTLQAELHKRGEYELVGGITYLTALFDAVPHAANAEYYARIVKDKSTLRNVIDAGLKVATLARKEDAEAVAMVEKAESIMFNLKDAKSTDSFATMKEIISAFETKLALHCENPALLIGSPTGLATYDNHTNGLKSNELTIIAARPSMGKTTLMTSMAAGMTLESSRPTLIVSAEMSREQVFVRMICAMAEIDSFALERGHLSAEDWERYKLAKTTLMDAQITVDDRKRPTPAHIRSLARRTKAEYGDIGGIFVDYIGLMRSDRHIENKVEMLGTIAYALKDMSGELKVPVVALAQLNRQVEMREDKRPTLSDIRASGEIEEAADVICAIYRAEYYSCKGKVGLDASRLQEAELLFLKNRNGATGMVKVGFIERYTQFSDLQGLAPNEPTGY